MQALESVQGGLEHGSSAGSADGGGAGPPLASLLRAVPVAAQEAAAAYAQVRLQQAGVLLTRTSQCLAARY